MREHVTNPATRELGYPASRAAEGYYSVQRLQPLVVTYLEERQRRPTSRSVIAYASRELDQPHLWHGHLQTVFKQFYVLDS